jgi:hypothetical protein
MMRAKMQVSAVKRLVGADGNVTGEELLAYPVCGNAPFGPNGESEDNTFARFTPSGQLSLTVNNPDLLGKFKPGQKFYVDFTLAE